MKDSDTEANEDVLAKAYYRGTFPAVIHCLICRRPITSQRPGLVEQTGNTMHIDCLSSESIRDIEHGS